MNILKSFIIVIAFLAGKSLGHTTTIGLKQQVATAVADVGTVGALVLANLCAFSPVVWPPLPL